MNKKSKSAAGFGVTKFISVVAMNPATLTFRHKFDLGVQRCDSKIMPIEQMPI